MLLGNDGECIWCSSDEDLETIFIEELDGEYEVCRECRENDGYEIV